MKANFWVLEDGMRYKKTSTKADEKETKKFEIIERIRRIGGGKYSRIVKVDDSKGEASLDYCGIIVLGRDFIGVLPKRSLRKCGSDSEYEQAAIKLLPLLVQVLLRFYHESSGRVEELVDDFLFADDNENASNTLAAAIHLLEDYERDGLLRRRKKERKRDGFGKIDWNRTIQRTPAIMSESGPFYPSPISVASSNDVLDPLIMIHRACIKDCYRRWGWLFQPSRISLSSIDRVFSDDADWLPFDFDEVMMVLERSLSLSFSDREMSVIRFMQAYIRAKQDPESQNVFGVTKYHRVWEHICKWVFKDNQRFYESDFLPQPKWEIRKKRRAIASRGKLGGFQVYGQKSMKEEYKKQIPDVMLRRKETFFILDAKYYNFEYSMPGAPDIIKQYYYEDTIRDHLLQDDVDTLGVTQTSNAFIMPDYPGSGISGHGIEFQGIAKFDLLPDWRSLPVFTIDATDAMEAYANRDEKRVPCEQWLDVIEGQLATPLEGKN